MMGPSPNEEGLPSIGPLKDPTWVCARGPFSEAHEDKADLLGTYTLRVLVKMDRRLCPPLVAH